MNPMPSSTMLILTGHIEGVRHRLKLAGICDAVVNIAFGANGVEFDVVTMAASCGRKVVGTGRSLFDAEQEALEWVRRDQGGDHFAQVARMEAAGAAMSADPFE